MTDEFCESYFRKLIYADDAQKKTTKAFLATEQTIPGLGNGVLQDILYNARIHPKTRIHSLSAGLFGKSGGYIPHLSKNTAGTICPRCEDMIKKENYLGGSIYYCSGCQPIQ